MEIYYPGGGGLDPLYQAIANQLRQNLGIDATAKPSADWAEFLQNRNDQNITGPFFSRWGALYPSQQATLRSGWPSGGPRRGTSVAQRSIAFGQRGAKAQPAGMARRSGGEPGMPVSSRRGPCRAGKECSRPSL